MDTTNPDLRNNTMTPEEINIAIAEHCDLFRLRPLRRTTRKGKEDHNGVVLWYCDSHPWDGAEYRRLPDYTQDLNAMYQAEKSLSDDERWEQIKILTGWKPAPSGFPLIGRFEAAALLTATAAHRAETFLRTVGKFKEPTP